MNKMTIGILSAVLAFSCVGAWADDSTTTTSTTTTDNVNGGTLSKSLFEIKPEVGSTTFTNSFGSSDTRGVAGLDVEFNLTGLVPQGSPLYTGIQSGLIYSHLGQAGSGFFGADSPSNTTAPGANMFLIPADAKLGWNVLDQLRLSVHGGGNVIYRSVGSSMNLGSSSGTDSSVWRIFPNAGADLDFQLMRGTTVMLRPDWTVTPGDTIFTATIGLGISLG
jgi:hypothetical protein